MSIITSRESVTLTSAGQKMFGIIHRPTAHGTYPAVVLFHGFLGSKDQPHRILVETAEALAKSGIIAFRVDLRGRGDSEGESVDMTWQGDLLDAQAALDWLATAPGVDANRLGAAGLSWGGILAPVLAGRDQRVKAAVSWSAVPVERLNWKPEFTLMDGREVAEIFAMLVGKQFYDGLPEFNPLLEAQKSRSPMLVIYGSDDESVPPADVAHFQQAIAATGNTCDVQVIEGADHIFFRYVWKRQAIQQIVAWLIDKL